MTEQERDFSVSTATWSGLRGIVLSGELDELAAPSLEAAMVAGSDELPVLVDLSALTFISSSGLNALLRERPEGRPAVVCPPGNVRRVLEIVAAHKTLAVFDSAEEAVAKLCG